MVGSGFEGDSSAPLDLRLTEAMTPISERFIVVTVRSEIAQQFGKQRHDVAAGNQIFQHEIEPRAE